MFVSLKKKTILMVAAVILCVVSFAVIVSASALGAQSGVKNGKVVVIDAGHGGIDGGVVGVSTGTKESDINLAIARSLKHFLSSKGYEVVMTRSSTDGLYGMATKNRKLKDMEERKRIINEARPDLVVSIHQNSFPRSNQTGAQVFYAPKSDEGKRISDIMQSTLNASLSSGREAKQGDYFILQCSEFPSMLIECGFLSTAEEEKLLVSAAYQEKVAYCIFTGIHSILGGADTHI